MAPRVRLRPSLLGMRTTASSTAPQLSRLGWGALATLVVYGALAMHVLAGGQHTAHMAVSTAGTVASHHGSHAPVPAAADATSVVDAAVGGSTDAAAGCDSDACGPADATMVCFALPMSLALATVNRRVGSWLDISPQPCAVTDTAAERPVLPRVSPMRLGISRT